MFHGYNNTSHEALAASNPMKSHNTLDPPKTTPERSQLSTYFQNSTPSRSFSGSKPTFNNVLMSVKSANVTSLPPNATPSMSNLGTNPSYTNSSMPVDHLRSYNITTTFSPNVTTAISDNGACLSVSANQTYSPSQSTMQASGSTVTKGLPANPCCFVVQDTIDVRYWAGESSTTI